MNERVLCQETLHERDSFRRVRQYLQGHHPKLGKLHDGWSGPETIVERDVVKAVGRFYVEKQPVTIPANPPRWGTELKTTTLAYKQSLWP